MSFAIAAAVNGMVIGALIFFSVVFTGWFSVPLGVYAMIQPVLFDWCRKNLQH